jgi:hypothetical protein
MRSNTLFTTVLAIILCLTTRATAHDDNQTAAYTLTDDLSYENFFSAFDFFHGPDPTNGFVQFQDLPSSIDQNLIGYLEDTQSVFMGVDYVNKDPKGRASVRLESKKTWDQGLMIADIRHMPSSICSTWPALWLIGSDLKTGKMDQWPEFGEIDILEGVNDYDSNSITLHTSKGCVVDNSTSGSMGQAGNNNLDASFTGLMTTGDCDVNADGQGKNVGCSIHAPKTMSSAQMAADSSSKTATPHPSYGTAFNAAGGGVYATEWTPTSISVWFIPRSSPLYTTHFTNTTIPDPSQWGTPMAHFSGSGCEFDAHFQNLKVLFDTTFCGEWAGKEWDKSCAKKTGVATCEAYVRDNPDVFKEAFWEIAGLKMYQKDVADRHAKRGDAGAEFVKVKGRFQRV